MTVIFTEGFDSYNGVGVNVGLASRGYTVGSNYTMQTGRFAGQCLQTTSTGTSAQLCTGPAWASTAASFCFGAALNYNWGSMVGTSCQLIFKNGSTYQLGIRFNTDGSIAAYRLTSATAGTLLGTSPANSILNGVFQYLEVEAVISDTVGRVTIYVDSVQVLNLTAQDTNNAGTLCDRFEFQGGGSGFSNICKWDDLYVVDAAAKLGERKIELLVPTSDVATGFVKNTGTSNFGAVDEGAAANSDTDYVQGSNVGDVDTYGFSDLTGSPATVDAVRVIAFAEKTDVGTRSINLQLISGATTDNGAAFPLATAYGLSTRTLTADPNGSIPWTAAAVNALTGGPRVAA